MTKQINVFILLFIFGSVFNYAYQSSQTEGYEERRHHNGLLQYKAIDSNSDGKFDTFYYYDLEGKLERQEIDSKHIGAIDIIIYYLEGVYISRIDRDVDGTGLFKDKKFFN